MIFPYRVEVKYAGIGRKIVRFCRTKHDADHHRRLNTPATAMRAFIVDRATGEDVE